jgi:branched-chain amino acid transport system permease protein
MSLSLPQLLSGLAETTPLFLVAAGLSLVFAVTRVVNFAQGSFYMLGAYLAVALFGTRVPGVGETGAWLALLAAALAVGGLGAAMEVLVLRRLYRAPQLYQLLAGLGVMLIVRDLVPRHWGAAPMATPQVPELFRPVVVAGGTLADYDLVLLALGPLALGGLLLLLYGTAWGSLVRAAKSDADMLSALGVRRKLLITSVVFLGTALAGLGGALQVPRAPAAPGMDLDMLVWAFMAVVIGGMGSIPGAFLGALVVALLRTLGLLVLPQFTLGLLFLAVAAVLVARPQGLLGGRLVLREGPPDAAARPLAPGGRKPWSVLLVVLAALGALPFAAPHIGGEAVLVTVIEIMILALFAASLQFLVGLGGIAAFGHAAFLGLGAYGAGLAAVQLALPSELVLLGAPLAAAVAALVFGWFCLRQPGAQVAILTLLFAQVAWAGTLWWAARPGGAPGVQGLSPSDWMRDLVPGGLLSEAAVLYYLVAGLVTLALLALRAIAFSPFGYTLRATRDSPLRAGAIGIDRQSHRWLAFALAGAFAGLAGGLQLYLEGSVGPEALGLSASVEALAMVLLGGVQTLTGPMLGAALYHGAETRLLIGMPSAGYWPLATGLLIVAFALLLPHGILGSLQRLGGRSR